jgi:hypothetical protein
MMCKKLRNSASIPPNLSLEELVPKVCIVSLGHLLFWSSHFTPCCLAYSADEVFH